MQQRAQGFSLIEVLVAVLVLSVGVLGIAGMQLLSLQHNTSSMYRTQAVQAAYDLLDRARVNREQAYGLDFDSDPPTAPDCTQQSCSPQQMRDYDLATWRAQLAAELPQGRGAVSSTAGRIDVRVRWQDSRSAGAALTEFRVVSVR